MGAWSTHPFGNDSALDWLPELTAPIEKALTKGSEHELLAAVQTAITLDKDGDVPFHVSVSAHTEASKRLDDLLNSEWIDSWVDTKKITKQIKKLRKDFLKVPRF